MKNKIIGYKVTEDCQLNYHNFEQGDEIIIADHCEDNDWPGTDWYDSYPQIFEKIYEWTISKNGTSSLSNEYFWNSWHKDKVMAKVFHLDGKWVIRIWEMGKQPDEPRKEWKGKRGYSQLNTALFKAKLFLGDAYYELYPENEPA